MLSAQILLVVMRSVLANTALASAVFQEAGLGGPQTGVLISGATLNTSYDLSFRVCDKQNTPSSWCCGED